MLFVPRLQTLMVGADGDGMEGYEPSPFPESHDDGIRLLFSGRPRPSLLGSSSCIVKNEGKGSKMTGFQRHQKIVTLMDILKPSQTSMA